MRPSVAFAALLLAAGLLMAYADEFNVYFDTSKPLGLKLDSNLVVLGFHRQGSTKMPAEASGWIKANDMLIAVNEQSTVGVPLLSVQQMVANAEVPKKLTFRAGGSSNRTAEMAAKYDGPQGIHGHEGMLEMARDGVPMGAVPYLQAMFGGLTSCRAAPLVLASAPHGCGAYKNADKAFDAMVLVERGVCPFSHKAYMAQQYSALGVIVMNDGGEVVRMPIDPDDKSDITVPTVMIDAGDAESILELLRHNNANTATGSVRSPIVARMVRKGQSCKPWRQATVVGESSANAKAPGQEGEASGTGGLGDPAAPSGQVFFYLPTPDTAGLDMAPAAKDDKQGARRAEGKSEGEGEGEREREEGEPRPEWESGEGEGHVHAAGYYSDQDRGVDGLVHTDENGLPYDEHTKKLTAGTRAARMLAAKKEAAAAAAAEAGATLGSAHTLPSAVASRITAGADGTGEEVLVAVDVDAEGNPLPTAVPVPLGGVEAHPDGTATETAEARLARLKATAAGRAEYIKAKFGGTSMPGVPVRVLYANPPDACDPLNAAAPAPAYTKQAPLSPASAAATASGGASPLKQTKTAGGTGNNNVAAAPPTTGFEGAAVVVDRGGCSFEEKRANVAAAGASVMLVVNSHANIFAMQASAKTAGGKTAAAGGAGGAAAHEAAVDAALAAALGLPLSPDDMPAMMISKSAGQAVRDLMARAQAITDNVTAATGARPPVLDARGLPVESGGGGGGGAGSPDPHPEHWYLTMRVIGNSAYAAQWDELSSLVDPAAWPEAAAQRRKLYLRLSRVHHPDRSTGSDDRFELLNYLYRRANWKADPSSEPDFVDDGTMPVAGG